MNEKPNISIEVSPEVASGHYSNLAIISHSGSEFILDFAQMLPGNNNNAKICSRIIMTPEHAKRLMNALVDFKQAKPSGTLNITDLMGGNGSRS